MPKIRKIGIMPVKPADFKESVKKEIDSIQQETGEQFTDEVIMKLDKKLSLNQIAKLRELIYPTTPIKEEDCPPVETAFAFWKRIEQEVKNDAASNHEKKS